MKLSRGVRHSAQRLALWPIALVTCCVLALAVLVPGLGQPGLWEPQERQLADRVAPPSSVVKPEAPEAPPPKDGCVRIPPKDAAARTLTPRALEFGRDAISDDDFGRRLPLALLALFTVLAAAGIAMRAINARAGMITALVLLSMPLLVLQGRIVTSEIGTACGSSMIIYGLLAFARPARTGFALVLLDKLVALAALGFGLVVGFYGGGALLGVAVPVGAFAAAGAFGIPLVLAAARGERVTPHVPALLAAIGAATVLAALAYQLYELKDPYPGISPPARSMFGRAIVAEGCWSWGLGATWRPEDDLRFIYDSAFEQIAFGTYPWGIVAPIAMAALLGDPDPARRHTGALALAWAGAAWIATEAFQRKVGFTIWAGFPALAIAVGAWLESLLARRQAIEHEGGRDEARTLGIPVAGALLIGLFVALAVLDFGKDIQSFAEKLTSLLSGSETVTYPKEAHLLGFELKRWVLLLGMVVGLGFALSMMLWRPGASERARSLRRIARMAIAVAFAGSIALGAFWSFVWQPRLASYLSSKTMLETVLERRAPADPLVIMGDLGHAPKHYAPEIVPETAASRADVVAALKRPQRVFAIAPRSELCPLHREQGDKPYFVLEERNLRNLLFSNALDPGHADKNPLATAILHTEPQQIQHRPKGKVVWDNRIQLLGWNIPASVKRGATFEVTLFYKILNQVSGNWKSIMHFDGSARFLGDHEPINGICPTSTWTKGDYIVDRVQVVAGGSTYSPGRYELWIGFFTGSAPNFRNMTLTEAPGDIRDTTDRVKITAIQLEGGGCSASTDASSSLVLLVLGGVLWRRRAVRRAAR